jgi:glycine cleavage system H protein
MEINAELQDELESLAEDPYGKGWFLKIKIGKLSDELLTAEEYKKLVDEN